MPDVNHHRVLLVDDYDDARAALAAVLAASGFSVSEAGDGDEALTQLQTGIEPCLVLLDLMMPRLDGYGFREAQLRDPRLASIPVVVVSGAGRLDERAAQLGIRDYVTKPIEVDHFIATLRRYCRPD